MRGAWIVVAALVGCGSKGGGERPRDAGAGDAGDNPLAPYQLRDLGVGRCFAINAAGQVLGLEDGQSFVLTGTARGALGRLGSDASTIGLGIDDSGAVVGFSDGDGGRRAVRWSAGAWRELALPAGSLASAVNGAGMIAGAFSPTPVTGLDRVPVRHAFVFSATLGDLGSGTRNSAAVAINASGTVVGIVEDAAGQTRGFRADGSGAMTELGTLGGPTSNALGVNARGDVVGASDTAAGEVHGFVWQGGVMRDLGPGEARAIADDGLVIGNAVSGPGQSRPFIWRDTQLDLPMAGYRSARAEAVSPSGVIVGWGLTDDAAGALRCLEWTP